MEREEERRGLVGREGEKKGLEGVERGLHEEKTHHGRSSELIFVI